MDFTDKLYDVLRLAAEKHGGKLPSQLWKQITREFYAQEHGKKSKRTKPLTRPDLNDAEWLAFLKADPDFKGYDVDAQFEKMNFWCRVNGKQPTRLRFLRWLSKADKVIVNSQTQNQPDIYKEPPEWRGTAQQILPDCRLSDEIREGKAWEDVPAETRAKIVRALP